MMRAVKALVVVLALLAAPPARAEKRWYGWEILVLDGAVAGIVALGATTDQDWMIYSAAGLFLFTGVVPHLLVRARQKVWLSIGARVANPLLFGYIGMKLGGCDRGLDETGCREGFPLGGLIFGAVLAVVFDQTQAFLTVDATPSGTPLVGVAGRF